MSCPKVKSRRTDYCAWWSRSSSSLLSFTAQRARNRRHSVTVGADYGRSRPHPDAREMHLGGGTTLAARPKSWTVFSVTHVSRFTDSFQAEFQSFADHSSRGDRWYPRRLERAWLTVAPYQRCARLEVSSGAGQWPLERSARMVAAVMPVSCSISFAA